MADLEKNDRAAVLVGKFIKSHRDAARRNGRRLSQGGLLELMAERGEGHAAVFVPTDGGGAALQ